MRLSEIKKLVEGTADAAFALDPDGRITAWNQAAESLFGVFRDEALGKGCAEVLHGVDECGRNCGDSCTIRQMAQNRQPLKSYDIQVRSGERPQWCSVSVLIVDESKSVHPHTVHIARPADLTKRFELLMRDFVVSETDLPPVHIDALRPARRTPTNFTELSTRETEILRAMARGAKSAEIAAELFISRTTVNNHIQHIFKKLDAHSRLEAVRRAEQAGLI